LNIPVQDLKRHVAPLKEELCAACNEVVESGWFVVGRQVAEFEAEFSRYLQAPHCVTVANGTDALELALRAVGVKAGDNVVMAANAGMYSSVAALAVGARPVYAEIELERLSIDPARVRELLPRARAVVLTHLYGLAGHVREIAELCAAANVPLIEDCAECHGAKVEGRALGTWGDIGCFSFYPTKNLGALGDGGACVTRNPDFAANLKRLRQYGWESRYHAVEPGGRNSRLDEMQAAVLRRKLPHLERWNERRRTIARRYNEAFAGLPIITPLIEDESYVGHLYVVRTSRRDEFRVGLKQAGVSTDVHFPTPDFDQPALAGMIGTIELPLTRKACAEVVSLPCFPEMTDAEVQHVISAVRSL
jgi:dTDP-4-amino-4,6-dideoxygalactose transaminase